MMIIRADLAMAFADQGRWAEVFHMHTYLGRYMNSNKRNAGAQHQDTVRESTTLEVYSPQAASFVASLATNGEVVYLREESLRHNQKT